MMGKIVNWSRQRVCSKRGPRVWQDIQVQPSQPKPGIGMCNPGRICGKSSRVMTWIPWHTEDHQDFWEYSICRNTDRLCWEEQRQDEMKEECQTSGIPQAGNRLLEYPKYNHTLPFKKKRQCLQRQSCCRGSGHRARPGGGANVFSTGQNGAGSISRGSKSGSS